jgi:hypothetical protein
MHCFGTKGNGRKTQLDQYGYPWFASKPWPGNGQLRLQGNPQAEQDAGAGTRPAREWPLRRETVILPEARLRHDALGPSGTGKTHIAPASIWPPARRGRSVSFTTAAAFAIGLEPMAPRWLTQ